MYLTKLNRSAIILFVLLLSVCCRDKKGIAPECDSVKIDVKEVGELDYKEHFCATTIIPLETVEKSLIGQIDKLYMTKNHILIFDTKGMNILLFAKNGRFIRTIGKKGGGPDEYQFFNDIQYNQEDSLIYAYERYQNRIHKYALSGELVEKTAISEIDFNSFLKTGSGYWVYSCFKRNNPDGYNLMLLDNDLKTVKKSFFPQKAFINAVSSSTFMESEDGRAFFVYPSSNIIYELVNEDAIPFVQINFGEKNMPYDLIVNTTDMVEYDRMIADKKYLGNIADCKINSKSFYFSFSETGFNIPVSRYSCLYSFSTKHALVYKNPFIASMNYPVSTELLYASDDALIYSMNLMAMTDDSYGILSEKLSADIRYDSNPVLVLLKLTQ